MTAADGITLAVIEGEVQVFVEGVFPLPYEVKPTPNWNTTVDVTGKTSLSYLLEFATPAPANAFVDVILVA